MTCTPKLNNFGVHVMGVLFLPITSQLAFSFSKQPLIGGLNPYFYA